MTNTTPESQSPAVSPRVLDAAHSLRGQPFITAEPTPEGLRLTGRKALLGRVAILTEDDVRRARDIRHQQAQNNGLCDAAMWALIQAPEPRKAELAKLVESEESEESETHAELQAIEAKLRGHPLFRAQVQGSGLALYAGTSPRTAYMNEAVARGAYARGGSDEVTRLALLALGWWETPPADAAGASEPVKAGDLHLTATCDTSQPIAALDELEAKVDRVSLKIQRDTVTLSDVTGAIAACAGALNALGEAGTRVPGEQQEKAAGCLVALVERAKQLACGAE